MSWSLIEHDALGTLIVAVVAICVLLLAELLKRTTSLPTELTRKFAHIGSGFAVLLIPVFITSSWTVLVLAGGFAGLMLTTHVTGLLQGVHGVGRGVGGVLWYPITAWLLFFLVLDVRDGTYVEYAIPVLVLACADAMGAVVGRRWGRRRYEVAPGHFRSLEGSAAFFGVALACIAIPLTFGLGIDPVRALTIATLVAALATAYESVSVHGLDNLLVPLGTLLFLERYLHLDSQALALQAVLIMVIVACAAAMRWRRPATGGGASAFVLTVFTVVVIGGWAWVPPMAALVLAFVTYDRLAPIPNRMAKARYELGTALIGLTVPVVLVLLHASFRSESVQHALYVGYVASIACQGAVLYFLLPQHRTFRLTRLRRMITVRDPWQHAPTTGKLIFAGLGTACVLIASFALLRPSALLAAPISELTMVAAACIAGLAAFAVLAATRCARRSCPACGNITLHGLGCCHDLDLGVGDTVSLRTITFRKTYLAANVLAAALATMAVVAWSA